MKQLTCIKCAGPRDKGRTLCGDCYKQHKRSKEKERYRNNGRYMYELVCCACANTFKGWRKKQRWCKDCYSTRQVLVRNKQKATNRYEFTRTPGRTEHRDFAEFILNRTLRNDETVHHLDHDPKNNQDSNLIVMTRKTHNQLHHYLDDQRAILEKSGIVNSEDCWKTLIAPMTTAWLETTSAKVTKLWEIGQSAGEHRTGEASETMHGTPDHLVEGEDIVQTTTKGSGNRE